MTLVFVLKILHVIAASIWIGGGLTTSRDIGRTLPLGRAHGEELMARLRATARLMNRSALMTLLSGIALVLVIGGFARVPHRIHVGLGLTLLAVGAGRFLIRPVIGEIARAAKEPVSPSDVARIVTRFRIGIGIEHALRLAVLVLMIHPFTF
jgi:putative copper export protein